MDPFTSHSIESEAGLGKEILAIHGSHNKTAPSITAIKLMAGDDDSVVSGASEAFSYDCGIDDNYFASESECEQAKPKRKKKLKPKANANASSGTAQPQAAPTATTTKRRPSNTAAAATTKAGTTTKAKKKSIAKKTATNKKTDESPLVNEFNACKLNAGSTMEAYYSESMTEGDTTDNDVSKSRRRVRTRRKKSNTAKIETNPEETETAMMEEFNASTLNAGSTMEDYFSESGTDNDRSRSRPRRKRPVTRMASHESNASTRSRRSQSGGRTAAADSNSKSNLNVYVAASDTDGTGTAAKPKTKPKRASSKGGAAKKVKRQPQQQQDEMDDESIALESLTRGAAALGMSATSFEKEASLDLAKHNPAPASKRRKNPTEAFSHSATGLYRGRSLSPETQKRKKAVAQKRRNTISTSNSNTPEGTITEVASSSAVKKHRAPRRLKSHDALVRESQPKKPIRRAKSDGGPEPTRSRSRSNSRRPSKTRTNATPSRSRSGSNSQRPARTSAAPPPPKTLTKQRSQSLNLGVVVPSNNKKINGRRVHASETSPGGASKVSVSMSVNTMDQSLQSTQSMPSNATRGGTRRGSAGPQSLLAPPKRSKSADAKAKNGKKNKIKRAASKDSTTLPKAAPGARKKKAGATASAGNTRRSSSASKRTNTRTLKSLSAEHDLSEASEMDEDESIVSTKSVGTSFGAANSMLSGHIAKDSTGRNNLPLQPVLSSERKRTDAVISPFSNRTRDPSLFEESEASTVYSGASSVAPSVASNSSKWSKASGGLSNVPPKRNSTTPNTAIGAYFGRDDSAQDVFKNGSLRSSRESVSMASSMGGSLLSDYSKSSSESKSQGRNRLATSPFGHDSSSSDSMSSGPGKTISPFSTRAGLESSHTQTTLLATDHTNATPLIPDSDDEEDESASFHGEVPAPKTSKVESPPVTPVAALKDTVPKKQVSKTTSTPAPSVTAKKPTSSGAMNGKKTTGVIIKPPLTKGTTPAKPVSKKPVFEEFEDPVPRKRKEKRKASFWQRLCCRSADGAE